MDKIILLFFVIALLACNRVGDTKDIPAETIVSTVEGIEDNGGVQYSDSMISALVQANQPKPALNIDTLEVLRQVDCQRLGNIESYHFNSDSIAKYSKALPAVSAELRALLHVTHCFSNFANSTAFRSQIYYSEFNESHFSPSFELVVIQSGSSKFQKLILAQNYRNEQGDRYITAQLLNDSTIVRTTKQVHRYIQGIGKVDSTKTIVEQFILTDTGELVIR